MSEYQSTDSVIESVLGTSITRSLFQSGPFSSKEKNGQNPRKYLHSKYTKDTITPCQYSPSYE